MERIRLEGWKTGREKDWRDGREEGEKKLHPIFQSQSSNLPSPFFHPSNPNLPPFHPSIFRLSF
jgi:hypothetical protein